MFPFFTLSLAWGILLALSGAFLSFSVIYTMMYGHESADHLCRLVTPSTVNILTLMLCDLQRHPAIAHFCLTFFYFRCKCCTYLTINNFSGCLLSGRMQPFQFLGVERLKPDLVHSLAFRDPVTKIVCRRTNDIAKILPRMTLWPGVVDAFHLGVNQVEILKVVALLHPGVCCERPPENHFFFLKVTGA